MSNNKNDRDAVKRAFKLRQIAEQQRTRELTARHSGRRGPDDEEDDPFAGGMTADEFARCAAVRVMVTAMVHSLTHPLDSTRLQST